MANNFEIDLIGGNKRYHVGLQEMGRGEESTHSISFDGKRYAILAQGEEMLPVLEILNTLYPGAVRTSEALSGRASLIADADLQSLSKKVDKMAFQGKEPKVTSPWKWEDKAYHAAFKQEFAKRYLAGLEQDAHSAFLKTYLSERVRHVPLQKDFVEQFDQAIRARDVSGLASLLDHATEAELLTLNQMMKLEVPIKHQSSLKRFVFTQEALGELQAHIQDPEEGFSVAVAIADRKGTHLLASQKDQEKAPFAIHSVGKVFTGVLTLKLIQEGIISKKALHTPIHLVLSQETLASLPNPVQEHLRREKPTLHQVMLHEGGLGDYLHGYIGMIMRTILGGHIPDRKEMLPEDFLPFADEKTFSVGENHYSNLGLLLVGLALQNCAGTPFNELLKRHVLDPAKIKRFSSSRPDDGRFNPIDSSAGYIQGSPAGGYWTTAKDLCAFGSWISLQYQNSLFRELVKQYGGEFYSEGEFNHSGGIRSSSAYLTILPKEDVVIAILSDKALPGAEDLYLDIMSHLLRMN